MGRRRGHARCCGISLWCLLAIACVRAAGGSKKLDRTCRGAPVRFYGLPAITSYSSLLIIWATWMSQRSLAPR